MLEENVDHIIQLIQGHKHEAWHSHGHKHGHDHGHHHVSRQ